VVTAIGAEVLGEPPRLMHTGARLVDPGDGPAGTRIPWHNHTFTDEERALVPGRAARGVAPTRLLYGWYLDGSDDASGALVAVPRRFDDPLAPPAADPLAPWPGEIPVVAPPGALVLFTIELWHAALAPTTIPRRHLMGAHIQARRDRRTHREDHVHDGPGVAASCAACPAFSAAIAP
jgi:hypothetical protein